MFQRSSERTVIPNRKAERKKRALAIMGSTSPLLTPNFTPRRREEDILSASGVYYWMDECR
jgi:hypothetical protein